MTSDISGIIESCDAIAAGMLGLDLDAYKRNRLLCSWVEREFIINKRIQRMAQAVKRCQHAAATDALYVR